MTKKIDFFWFFHVCPHDKTSKLNKSMNLNTVSINDKMPLLSEKSDDKPCEEHKEVTSTSAHRVEIEKVIEVVREEYGEAKIRPILDDMAKIEAGLKKLGI